VLVGSALCANVVCAAVPGVVAVMAVMAVMTKLLVTVGARRRAIGISRRQSVPMWR
jgi:hypothetical protein